MLAPVGEPGGRGRAPATGRSWARGATATLATVDGATDGATRDRRGDDASTRERRSDDLATLERADDDVPTPVRRSDDGVRERRLVDRIVAGDETALALVYDGWSPHVFTLALRVCRDRALAEDVTQEVFVHLWQRADTFDAGRASLRTWLGMLTHRRSVDRVRREEARRQREDRDQRRSVATPADTEDLAIRSVTSDHLAQALAALPEEQRACVMLAYFDGKTFKEVAAALGIPEGTAKSRIRLALGKLAGLLEETTP